MPRADGMGIKGMSVRRRLLLIATGLVLLFIFVQSLLPEGVSAGESGWFSEHILNPITAFFGLGPVSHQIVRKLAHIFEFTVLSALLALSCRGRVIKSFGFGFLFAFLDESTQLLSGRGAQLSDVWIDLIGVALGTLLGLLLWKAIRSQRFDTQTRQRFLFHCKGEKT